MTAPDPSIKTVRIFREKLYKQSGRAGRTAWKWTYSYSVDGAPVVGYGEHLASLRDRMKFRFPNAEIVTEWGAA